MLQKLLRLIPLKIRLWNPKYFPNPFYSPSLVFMEAAKDWGKVFNDILEEKKKEISK